MNKYKNSEFHRIVKPLLDSCPFEETKKNKHHGITRYEHSMRVAYFSYIVTKLLRLNYKETTEAALLHDFFTDEVKEKNGIARLRQHPSCAVENAKKYFELSAKQEDIIKTHMFPVTFTPPKYLESVIVDIVDDVASIYERVSATTHEVSYTTMVIVTMITNFIKFL